MSIYKDFYEENYGRIKQLEKENERLKKRQITKNGFICDCEQNMKYKQALEEIREILKGNKDGDIDEMIDEINEVLDER